MLVAGKPNSLMHWQALYDAPLCCNWNTQQALGLLRQGFYPELLLCVLRRAKGMMEGQRPGDWTCPSCSANNFSRRTECFRCQQPKYAQLWPQFNLQYDMI